MRSSRHRGSRLEQLPVSQLLAPQLLAGRERLPKQLSVLCDLVASFGWLGAGVHLHIVQGVEGGQVVPAAQADSLQD